MSDTSDSGGFAKPLIISLVVLLVLGAGSYFVLRSFDALPSWLQFSSSPSRQQAAQPRTRPAPQPDMPREAPFRPVETPPALPVQELPSLPSVTSPPPPAPAPEDVTKQAGAVPPDTHQETPPAPAEAQRADIPKEGDVPHNEGHLEPNADEHKDLPLSPDGPADNVLPPQRGEQSGPPSPPHDASPIPESPEQAPPAPNAEKSPSEPQPAAPIIEYGKGRPVSGRPSVSRGTVPARQRPVDTSSLYGRRNGLAGSPGMPQGQDTVLSPALFDDLASFLVSNYWPAGTHPLALGRGITTADVKLANMRYGGHLQGFAVRSTDPLQERARILRYVYTPSMLRGLYGLYAERFFSALERNAKEQESDHSGASLSDRQRSEMFGIYKALAGDIATLVLAYSTTPGIRDMISSFTLSSTEAASAYEHFAEGMHTNAADRAERARAYQAAIKKRERASSDIAAALRKKGSARSLDNDSVVYVALWLYRRGGEDSASLKALADILSDCSARLARLETQYATRASRP